MSEPDSASLPRSRIATCILHVGTNKTGSSSIQDSLYFGLTDPAFRYVSLGWVNSAVYLEPLFRGCPEDFWLFRMKRLSRRRIQWMRWNFAWRLRRTLSRARERGQTPIISAEDCWRMQPDDLVRLRDFLAAEAFRSQVIVYLRPIKSYLESAFQQQMKLPHGSFDPVFRATANVDPHSFHYTDKLGHLERVFGRENLIVRPFVRSALADGCAVRDFCQTLGINLPRDRVLRSNESVTLDAVRFLYSYQRFFPGGRPPSFGERFLLSRSLEALPGTPFRFHSTLLEPLQPTIAAEVASLRERYGIDLSEDLAASDAGPCVREETDLLRFSRESLDWLARASWSPPIQGREGEAVAREVAVQVDRIRRRPALRPRWDLLAGRMRTELRWVLHGD